MRTAISHVSITEWHGLTVEHDMGHLLLFEGIIAHLIGTGSSHAIP